MKGIRLTPFLLFLILLLVLVVAMIFGYRSNSVLENMETGNTGDWMVSNSAPVENYYNDRTLDEVLPSSGSAEGYYFDPNNGNIVVSSGANSSTFTVLTRSSDGKPTTVTSSYPENTQTSDSEITSMATPWSYNTNNISLLYCPYQTSTFIVLIDNSTDNILAVFKNTNGQSYSLSMSDLAGGQSTGITTNADLSLYSQLGVPQNDNIQVNGEALKVVKIQNDVYYSKQQGVIVGSPGDFSDQSISSSFQNGVSKQNNQAGSIMVLSVMIDSEHVLVAIIVKNNGNYQVASSNIVAQKAGSQDAGDDSFSITLKTEGNSGSLEGLAGSNGSSSSSNNGKGRSSSTSSDKCKDDDDDHEKPCYSKHSKANDTPKSKCSLESKSKCDDDEYIRKTEIVPPVCPACPTTNCPLSVNSNGEIVDCTGKKIDMGQIQGANQGSFSSSPESWAGAVGGTAEQTVKSAGDTIQTGLKEAGDTLQTGLQAAAPAVETTVKTAGSALENTVDQAGDALDKAFDTVGGAFNTTVGGVENIAGGIGQGLEDAGSGATGLLKDAGSGISDVAKDVVGFGNNVVDQTAGLIGGAGRGALEYGEREQQLEYDKMLQQQQQQQGQGQQGYGVQQSGYVPQQGYGYPQQGFAYGQPQQCCYSQQPTQGYSYPRSCSSNFMPITNDFSQFT